MTLNPDQQLAVDTHEGALCLQAGPGSGKTATLIARYKSMFARGISPAEILSVTFSKQAANEMQKRAGKGNFRTFHSFGYDVISKEKGRPPMEPELRNRLLFKLTKKYRLDYKELVSFISRMRYSGISPKQAMEESWYGMPQAYRDYETERRAAGWIDFDSMICDAVQLLENPEIRARHQYKYVMADECQDTDNVQFRILQLITERHGNVMCVGDPAQSVYLFRGAKPENLTNFTKWFPNGRYLYLGQNYRSTQTITTYVRENYPIATPLKEKLLPARPESGSEISYKMFHNELDESEEAVTLANADPLRSAILARTNRGLSHVENFCIEHKIRYTLLGSSGFWKQSEIARALKKLKLHTALPTETAMTLVMPDLMRYYEVDDRTQEDNDALENLRTLRTISLKFPACRDFVSFANRAAHAKPQKGITLSTIHQAKGTEYKNVFVIGARADLIPHVKGDPEEERRIWFVAISRAIDNLRISWSGTPSQFLRRYLPEDTLMKLHAEAAKVERLQKQQVLSF